MLRDDSVCSFFFFFQAEDGIRDLVRSRGLGDVYKRQDNGGGDPLPVELISFKADYFENLVHLSWSTATELNNSGFEVERKTDNNNWQKISFVSGNGTTTETVSYTHLRAHETVLDLVCRLLLEKKKYN